MGQANEPTTKTTCQPSEHVKTDPPEPEAEDDSDRIGGVGARGLFPVAYPFNTGAVIGPLTIRGPFTIPVEFVILTLLFTFSPLARYSLLKPLTK